MTDPSSAAPPRVLFVITDSGLGGSESVLTTLLSRLNRSRTIPCGVIVLKSKRERAAQWEQLGIPVTSLGMGRFPTPAVLRSLRAALLNARPDIVHAWLFQSIQAVRWVRRSLTFRLITSPRVNYGTLPGYGRWVDRCLKGKDDLVLCESDAGRRSLIEGQGYSPETIRVVRNGVDAARHRFDPTARENLRKEWGVSETDLVLGSVGRLVPQKGYDRFIAAAAPLKREGLIASLVIAGAGRDQAALASQATREGLPVRWLGERTDIPAVMSAMDVYVQSSRHEGLSNALLEAMAAGRPCVATAVDGTVEVAVDGQNALLVPPDDAPALRAALRRVALDSAFRRYLAENATIAAARFSLDAMVAGFENAYHSLIASTK